MSPSKRVTYARLVGQNATQCRKRGKDDAVSAPSSARTLAHPNLREERAKQLREMLRRGLVGQSRLPGRAARIEVRDPGPRDPAWREANDV